MNKISNNKFIDYLSPDIELVEVIVEQGFGDSNGQLPEYKEDDDEIILG